MKKYLIMLIISVFIVSLVLRLSYSYNKVYNFCEPNNITNKCILKSSPKGLLRIDGEYVISGGDVVIAKKVYIDNIKKELEEKSKLTFIEKILNKEYLYNVIGIN